ncbi:MAG: transporter [Planctomycetota bacterium]
MRKVLLAFAVNAAVGAFFPQSAIAAGISVDAGLTPPEDRWIFRTQFRYMSRKDDPTAMDRKMDMYAVPIVLAYGYRPDLTLLIRQPLRHTNMSMAGNISRDSGLDDLFLLGKYRLYRRNTREYTFGIAPTLGLELPTGDDDFTSETWDLQPGFFTSWRSGPWASDFNVSYKSNGFFDENDAGVDPGDELSIDLALAYQFSIGDEAEDSVAPVLEFTYKHLSPDRRSGHDIANTGESLFFVSPGVKYTISSLILEALLQIPTWQDQKGIQLEQGTRFLVGARVMF